MDDAAVGRVNELLADRRAGWATVTPSGDWLLARAGAEGFLVDLEAGEVRATFPVHRHLGPMPDADGTAFVTAGDEWVEVRGIPDCDRRHSIPVTSTHHTPTGRNLLAPGGEAVYLMADPPVGWARYDPTTGEPGPTYGRVDDDEMVSCFTLSADGSRAGVAGIKGPVSEGFLAVYEAETGDVIEHETLAYEVDRVALSPDGSDAVVCDGIGGLAGEGWRADDLDGVATDAQFVRDGREVISLTIEGTLDRWDAASGERLGRYETGESARFLSATADGSLMALSGATASLVGPGWTT